MENSSKLCAFDRFGVGVRENARKGMCIGVDRCNRDENACMLCYVFALVWTGPCPTKRGSEWSEGQFTRYDFCLWLSNAMSVVRAARTMQK